MPTANRDILSIWTVYDHPRDYPNDYVARRWEIESGGQKPTASIIIAADLETIRDMLQFEMNLTCLPREEGDDPAIVESWI